MSLVVVRRAANDIDQLDWKEQKAAISFVAAAMVLVVQSDTDSGSISFILGGCYKSLESSNERRLSSAAGDTKSSEVYPDD